MLRKVVEKGLKCFWLNKNHFQSFGSEFITISHGLHNNRLEHSRLDCEIDKDNKVISYH